MNHPTLTVKDVRRLHQCVICGEIGLHQPTHPGVDIPVLVCVHSTKAQRFTVSQRQCSFAHPRCYIAKTSMGNLLSLHSDEIGSIRIGDVTRRQMRRLLAELRSRKPSVEQ